MNKSTASILAHSEEFIFCFPEQNDFGLVIFFFSSASREASCETTTVFTKQKRPNPQSREYKVIEISFAFQFLQLGQDYITFITT